MEWPPPPRSLLPSLTAPMPVSARQVERATTAPDLLPDDDDGAKLTLVERVMRAITAEAEEGQYSCALPGRE